jgi:hypothetical protein
MSTNTHSSPHLRELLRRQQEARKELRYQRWRDIAAFDWASHGEQALELLELAHELGGPPRLTSGLAEWYAALLRQRHA